VPDIVIQTLSAIILGFFSCGINLIESQGDISCHYIVLCGTGAQETDINCFLDKRPLCNSRVLLLFIYVYIEKSVINNIIVPLDIVIFLLLLLRFSLLPGVEKISV
jgi:hypothetical protein